MLGSIKQKLPIFVRNSGVVGIIPSYCFLMEVLFGLANMLGYSEDELLKKRQEKFEERGGFKERIVLKRVNK